MNIEPGTLLIGAFVSFTVGVLFSTAVDTNNHRTTMIEQGCAYYDATTGDFTLKEKEE